VEATTPIDSTGYGFVDKDEHGVSSLYALSDFKDIRKNSDILKRYLLGAYGAIFGFGEAPERDRMGERN
jgi:hypothetical protein